MALQTQVEEKTLRQIEVGARYIHIGVDERDRRVVVAVVAVGIPGMKPVVVGSKCAVGLPALGACMQVGPKPERGVGQRGAVADAIAIDPVPVVFHLHIEVVLRKGIHPEQGQKKSDQEYILTSHDEIFFSLENQARSS